MIEDEEDQELFDVMFSQNKETKHYGDIAQACLDKFQFLIISSDERLFRGECIDDVNKLRGSKMVVQKESNRNEWIAQCQFIQTKFPSRKYDFTGGGFFYRMVAE